MGGKRGKVYENEDNDEYQQKSKEQKRSRNQSKTIKAFLFKSSDAAVALQKTEKMDQIQSSNQKVDPKSLKLNLDFLLVNKEK